MAFLRNINREKFTVIDNSAIRDDNLSLKALGLLVKLLSLPDNWEFSENGLEKAFKKDGQSSIRSGLKELENCGYLTRKKGRDDKGRIARVEWIITENPHLENPSLDNPNLDNQPQLNTKEPNTKRIERNKQESGSASAEPSDGFLMFWAEYPKKVGKIAALKAWNKIKPCKQLSEKIVSAVKTQKTWKSWTKDGGQYIPNPATWLNQGRWEDENMDAESTAEHNEADQSAAPRFEDIFRYAQENGISVDLEAFFEYYRQRGWTEHGQSVDWKQKLKRW